MNWKRVVAFVLLLYLAPQVVGFVQGLTIPLTWQLYGPTMEEAVHLFRPVRRVLIAAIAFALYVAFVRGIARRRSLHAAAVFALVTLVMFAETYAWTRSLAEAFDPAYVVAHSLIAAAAIGFSEVWRTRTAEIG